MTSKEQVAAVKVRMEKAEAALRAYATRTALIHPDPRLYVELANEFQESVKEYQNVIIALVKEGSIPFSTLGANSIDAQVK